MGSTSANLTKARFALEFGLKNVTYEECNIEDSGSEIGPHDLCVFLGLLYHLENPGAEPAQDQQHHWGGMHHRNPGVDESSPRAGANGRLAR